MNKKQVKVMCVFLAMVVLVMMFPPQNIVRKSEGITLKTIYWRSIFRAGEIYDCCRFDPAYCERYLATDIPQMCCFSVNLALLLGEMLVLVFSAGLFIYFLGNKEI
jgi:hypothetical protein